MVSVITKILDKRISKLFLFTIAVIGFIVTIYGTFFQNEIVQVQYVITSNSNVLDINTEISTVDILYDSISLKRSNQNLRIYNVKIINNGDTDILKSFYDDNVPLGIYIKNGVFADKPEILRSSSSYIKKYLKTSQKNNNKIEFSKVILEKDEYFIVKLLVLHKNSEQPQLIPIGKIAGLKHIELINSSELKDEEPFIVEAFSGTLWIQLVRLIFYFVFMFLFFIIYLWSSEIINDIRKSRKRKKIINNFKGNKDYEYNYLDDAIFEMYKEDGGVNFLQMRELITDEEQLNKCYKKGLERVNKNIELIHYQNLSLPFNDIDHDFSLIKLMINKGILNKENDSIVVNQQMRDKLLIFIKYLLESGEFNNEMNYFERSEIKRQRLINLNNRFND